MKAFKLFTLLVLGFLIFGSAGYFGYELFIKPNHAEKIEKSAVAAPTPTPDQGAEDLHKLEILLNSGKMVEARNGLKTWSDSHPKSTLLGKARQDLGTANMALLFQPQEASSSLQTYTVVKGDSLARIAGKFKSNAELIQRANSLPNINLQIGQQLVVPVLKISLEIDRTAKTLILQNEGVFLKEYTFVACPSPPAKPIAINSKVLDKVANSGAKRVAFGDKAYPQSTKSILLVQSPAIVSAIPSPSPLPSPDPTRTNSLPASQSTPSVPGGYVLSEENLGEIFPLVSRNTPVIIH